MGLGASVEDYADKLRQLLPRGSIWAAREGTRFRQLLDAFAVLLSATHLRANALLDELDPSITSEMLTDWERVLDIPGACGELGATLQQRRAEVLRKLTQLGGASPAYFIDLAERLGHPGATVEEYDYFRAGDPAGSPVRGIARIFSWTLHTLEAAALVYFRAGQSAAGEPVVAIVGSDALECSIEHAKPAHTTVVFSYGSA